MKKLFLLTALFLALAVSVSAVDTIVLFNGTMIDVKLEEITPTEIKYRRADNLNGPLVTINKSEVFSIKYDNGTTEVINEAAPMQAKAPAKGPRLNPKKLYTGVSFEPSGFISGGPSATLEFSKGAVNSSVHMSFPSLALNSAAQGFGFGLGGNLNYYWGGPIGGFFLGGLAEWNMFPYKRAYIHLYKTYNPVTDSFSSAADTEKVKAHNFVLGLNGGYKFILGNGIYFRTGISAGVIFSSLLNTGFYYKPDIATGFIF